MTLSLFNYTKAVTRRQFVWTWVFLNTIGIWAWFLPLLVGLALIGDSKETAGSVPFTGYAFLAGGSILYVLWLLSYISLHGRRLYTLGKSRAHLLWMLAIYVVLFALCLAKDNEHTEKVQVYQANQGTGIADEVVPGHEVIGYAGDVNNNGYMGNYGNAGVAVNGRESTPPPVRPNPHPTTPILQRTKERHVGFEESQVRVPPRPRVAEPSNSEARVEVAKQANRPAHPDINPRKRPTASVGRVERKATKPGSVPPPPPPPPPAPRKG